MHPVAPATDFPATSGLVAVILCLARRKGIEHRVTGRPGKSTANVILVDDDETYHRLLRSLPEREGDFNVLAEAGDVCEALDMMNRVDPDLIIMDVQLPSMDGFVGTLSRTGRQKGHSHIALEAGAIAFITKSALTVRVLRQLLQA